MRRAIAFVSFGFHLIFSLLTIDAHAQIEVVDDFGNRIKLDKPAERIISLAPHITETLFAAGAGEKIVATVQYSDFPEAATEIPVIGSSSEVSYEAIVSMNPDLVIAWASGNGEEVASRVSSLGFPVYKDEPRQLEDIAHSIQRFGDLAGTSAVASLAAEDFLARLSVLQSDDENRERVRVFYEVWNEPLTTLNGDHLISNIIELCGGVNVFAEAIPIAPVVSTESVLAADPQLIVVSGMGQERPEWLDEWTDWPGLTAAETGQLQFIPPDLLVRSAPRVIQGAEMMCEFVERARNAR